MVNEQTVLSRGRAVSVDGLSPRNPEGNPRAGIVDFIPGALAVVAVLVALVTTTTPLSAIARYAAYILFAVLIPGTLVHRALRGRSALLEADLALGAATGLALELIAWAVFTSLDVQAYLWAWPLLVLVPFIALPRLRHWWRFGHGTTERSRVTSWLLAAAFSYFTLSLAVFNLRTSSLPPRANLYYQDVYWHLSIAAELTRHVPPEVPQVAGRTLHYHWFSNAHIAASHLVSGVDLPIVMLRLWFFPVVAIVFGLMVALAHKATRLAWPGALAALIVIAPAQLIPWSWFRPFSSAAIIVGSPSLVFGLVFLLLGAHVLVDLARGAPLGRGWVVLLLAVGAAPGAKPSVLPALLGGLVVVMTLSLLRRRPIGRAAGASALIVTAVAVSNPLVAQSAAGSGFKLLGFLVWSRPWNSYVGNHTLPGTGGHVISGLGAHGAVLLALLLVASFLLQYVWVLAGLTLLRRGTRGDPAAWFLAGAVLAGLAATLIVDHPGASEIYFAKTITPLAAIVAAWGFAVALRLASESGSQRRTVVILAVGLGVTAGVVFAAGRISPRPTTVSETPQALAVPWAVLLLGAGVGAAVWWLLRATIYRGLAGAGAVLICAALIGCALIQGPESTVRAVRAAMISAPKAPPPSAVSADEAAAAGWLARHASANDVVATNVHCIFKITRPGCDARAFWLSALGEHRVLVEGWAYTEESLLRQGRGGRGFVTQPFDDPTLFAANENAFTDPSAEGLAELRDRHGVRWLYADRRAGPVSLVRLSKLAKLRFTTADVHVFQLFGSP
jgi:hypothetical protein